MSWFRFHRRKPTVRDWLLGGVAIGALVVFAAFLTHSQRVSRVTEIVAAWIVRKATGPRVVTNPGRYYEFKKGLWVWVPGRTEFSSKPLSAAPGLAHFRLIRYEGGKTKSIFMAERGKKRPTVARKEGTLSVLGHEAAVGSDPEREMVAVTIPDLYIEILCIGYTENEIREWLSLMTSKKPVAR